MKKAILFGSIGALALLALWALFGNIGVTNEGNKQEAQLSAQYENGINFLSDCVVRIRETAGVAKGQAAAFDEIIRGAVEGRYSPGSTAQVGRGQLFSAIVEAYPDLSSMGSTFDKVLITVNGCRTDYRQEQQKLQAMLAEYDSWRTGSFKVRFFGKGEFPSDNLRARDGEATLRGEDALAKMGRVIAIEEADEAYDTGTLKAEDPFGTNSN